MEDLAAGIGVLEGGGGGVGGVRDLFFRSHGTIAWHGMA